MTLLAEQAIPAPAPRLDFFTLAPATMDVLMTQEHNLRRQFSALPSLSLSLYELIKLRVSLLNQCAYCIDMHTKDAQAAGESAERILALSAWQDMPCFSAMERCALAWADAINSNQIIGDIQFESTRDQIGDQALVELTVAVNAIRSWNTIAKVFRPLAGSYQVN